MQWGEILLAIVVYCTGSPQKDQCRTDRIGCMKRAVEQNPKANDAIGISDQCFSNPALFPEKPKAPATKDEKKEVKK